MGGGRIIAVSACLPGSEVARPDTMRLLALCNICAKKTTVKGRLVSECDHTVWLLLGQHYAADRYWVPGFRQLLRRAVIGSMRDARRAGTFPATVTRASSKRTMPANVAG